MGTGMLRNPAPACSNISMLSVRGKKSLIQGLAVIFPYQFFLIKRENVRFVYSCCYIAFELGGRK